MKNKKIYLVGIKGVGMTALAIYFKERGKEIWGSDVEEIFPTDQILKNNKIKILKGFNSNNITNDIDLVITTAAHKGLNNKEVLRAKILNIPVRTYAQEIGHLMKAYKNKIVVCGSHGKTTTASYIAYVFHELGLCSSHIVGASSFSGLTGGHFGGLDYLVAEGDEYVSSPDIDNTPKFMYLIPDYIICTNVDWDHPDIYPTLDVMKEAFLNFFKQGIAQSNAKLIYNTSDKILTQLIKDLPKKNLIGYTFDRENINLIEALLSQLEIFPPKAVLNKIIRSFTGVKRRFEKVYEKNSVSLYDDYAHHPAEIDYLISQTKYTHPDKRIILIFKSHTYSRTKALENDFIASLSKADKTYILDIFPSARENKKDFIITSQSMVKKANELGVSNITYASDKKLITYIKEQVAIGRCIIITVGAGDVYKYHKDIIKLIANC